jgi:hypothetical protein
MGWFGSKDFAGTSSKALVSTRISDHSKVGCNASRSVASSEAEGRPSYRISNCHGNTTYPSISPKLLPVISQVVVIHISELSSIEQSRFL